MIHITKNFRNSARRNAGFTWIAGIFALAVILVAATIASSGAYRADAQTAPSCEPNAPVALSSSSDTQVEGGDAVVITDPNDAWTTITGAEWIWTADYDDEGSSPEGAFTFTDTFEIVGTPTESSLEIAADNTYSVLVNGDPIACESLDEDNFSSSDTCVIPAEVLVEGTNTITIEAVNLPAAAGPNPGGLIFSLSAESETCEVPDEFAQVFIYKYLDNGTTTEQVPDDSDFAPFPMTASWDAENSGPGTGNYELGDAEGGAAFNFAAVTSEMTIPVDFYTTYEVTTDVDPESHVLPMDAACEPDMFRLVGYQAGTSVEDAEGAPITDDEPVFENFGDDQYLIVVNEDCNDVLASAPEEGTSTIIIEKEVTGTTTEESFDFAADWIVGDVDFSLEAGSSTTFENLATGTYAVNELMPEGWMLDGVSCDDANSTSTETGAEINLEADETVTCTFTNTLEATTTPELTSLMGMKWNDLDGDGENDLGESGLEGVVIRVENTATSSTFVATTTTAADGSYEFVGLEEGDYLICEDVPAGWSQTYPSTSTDPFAACDEGFGYATTTTLLNPVLTGFDFGNMDDEVLECSIDVASDEETTVDENDDANAVLVSPIPAEWTAVIPGASWIWSEDPITSSSTATTTRTFTRTFVWDGPVTGATLAIATDNTYTVSLNGTEVGSSTDEINFTLATQDSYDVSGAMITGTNTLSIVVNNIPLEGGEEPEDNPAGLLYSLTAVGTDATCSVVEEDGDDDDDDDSGSGGGGGGSSSNNDDDDDDRRSSRRRGGGGSSSNNNDNDNDGEVLGSTITFTPGTGGGVVLGSTFPGFPNTGEGGGTRTTAMSLIALASVLAISTFSVRALKRA